MLETRLTRQQLEDQAVTLFGETGDVLEAPGSRATRTDQPADVDGVAAGVRSPAGQRRDADELARRTLSVVRTSDAPLEIVGWWRSPPARSAPWAAVADGSCPRIPSLPTRWRGGGQQQPAGRPPPGRRVRAGLRPVGGAARPGPAAARDRLPAERRRARRYLADRGGRGRAGGRARSSPPPPPTASGARRSAVGTGRARDPALEDGRLVRYVALGADRAWDTPAAVGLITDDPLGALDAALARTAR
jgi:hypothetical protein